MDIRILPSNIANMIAAGEVVQRPASVVKELMENAVDAGADQVTVVIQDSGRTLVQVIDNGCGMTPDQAVLCFERHATSKLRTAEDLMDIHTFGFRGEALASIAAVAEVTLKTRREDDEVGCQVDMADSQHLSTQEVSAPRGSNFAVRNLFYNVPARRKFLKSDNVEFKHIVSEFIRVALTRPETGFTLTHNGKDVYVLRPAKSLKFRIQDVLGTNVANDVVDIQTETSVVGIKGFIGRPDTAKKALGNQYFFVNGRFFKSPYLHKAVMKAYENLIPEGATPTYFIYMDVDPQAVDVNIHPTKTEIKFEEDNVIFQVLYACIKESLGRNSFADSIDFDREGVPEIPAFGKSFDEFRPISEPMADFDPSYNPFDQDGYDQPAAGQQTFQKPQFNTSQFVEKRDDYGKLFEDKLAPTKSLIVLQDRYVITSSRSGLMAVNIHRAMERILYERFLEAISKSSHVTQTALFPVTVYVGVENMCIIQDNLPLLTSLGFDITPFGHDEIVVNGVPEGYSAEAGKVQAMVSDLLLILSDEREALPEMMAVNMASKLAMLGSHSCDSVSNSAQAQRLIDSLFACETPEYTISGRKIVSIIPIEEIDKKF